VKNKLIFWIIPPIVVWLMIYAITALSFPWNADFVSIILAVKEIFRDKIYLSPDTFLIKYPIILILNNFVEYGRKYMWIFQMTNGVIMAAGYVWYFTDFAKDFSAKKYQGPR